MRTFQKHARNIRGVTMIELMCVILIISILAAFYLPVISKAFVHVKHFLGDFSK